jgi:hypothetical protein
MKKIQLLAIAGLSISLLAPSCKKKEETTPTTNLPSANSPATPSPSDAKGVFAAVQTSTYQEVPGVAPIEIVIGLATGGIFDVQGTFLDAGTVKCDNNPLKLYTNQTYLNEISQTNPQGIDFGNSVAWSIGGSANVSAFDYSDTQSWPTKPVLSISNTTISHSGEYVLNLVSPIVNCDSVIFTIAGGSGNATLQKTKPNGVQSVTFSASEMNSLGTGSGIIQAAAYKLNPQNKGGRKIYFIKETVNTKSVTFN